MKSSVKQMWKVGLFVVILLLGVLDLGSSEVLQYQISLSPTDQCPTEFCLTLNNFADNLSAYAHPNLVMIFNSGNHTLELNVSITDIIMLSLISNRIFPRTVITCDRRAVLIVDNVSYVHISNLTFVGCALQLIFVNKLILENSHFLGGTDASSTALELFKTSAIFIRSKFSYNTANKLWNVPCHIYSAWNEIQAMVGGAIVLNQSNITIKECVFEGNKGDLGGVIFSELSNNITILNSTFKSNEASIETPCKSVGGVLYAGKGSTVMINNCYFFNNTAQHGGGVVALYNVSHITITQSEFNKNRATKGIGGVLCTDDGTRITIVQSRFLNNKAQSYGGIMYVVYVYARGAPNVTICDSVFVSNHALKGGGVLSTRYSSISVMISHSRFINNSAAKVGGGVAHLRDSVMFIVFTNCEFVNNNAPSGGVIFTFEHNIGSIVFGHCECINNGVLNHGGVLGIFGSTPNITLSHSVLFSNSAVAKGGVIFADGPADITITHSELMSNTCGFGGGIIALSFGGRIHIIHSEFISNTAGNHGSISDSGFGGIIYVDGIVCELNIAYSVFTNSSSQQGGGVLNIAGHCNITIFHCEFNKNSAQGDGGFLCTAYASEVHIKVTESNFFENRAVNDGGTVKSFFGSLSVDNSSFHNNSAGGNGGVFHLYQTSLIISQTIFKYNRASNNGGGMHSEEGIIVVSNSKFSGNLAGSLGGAMSLEQVYSMLFKGTNVLLYNHAVCGGGLHVEYSKVYVRGWSTIAYNIATKDGGGIFLHGSELYCLNDTINLLGNVALVNGGGIHAGTSVIVVADDLNSHAHSSSSIQFVDNMARNGGGLCLEYDAQLYIKSVMNTLSLFSAVNFTANSADYGGALYISDGSVFIAGYYCSGASYGFHIRAKECFVQTLASSNSGQKNNSLVLFSKNIAHVYGSSLFGGQLNRCFLTQKKLGYDNTSEYPYLYDSHYELVDGILYIRDISTISLSDISSEPVQVCFCKEDEPVCGYHPKPLRVVKGKQFSVKVVALDQAGHPVNATIYSSPYQSGGLKKGQSTQYTSEACTRLKFNFFSPGNKEDLVMSAKGPCEYSLQSQARLSIHFTSCDFCPIGFERFDDEESVCHCVCDSRLEPYITRCNASTEMLERDGSYWITYVTTSDNTSSGYLIYPHCPLNYCVHPSSKVEVNLNIPNGADVQCADGRSDTLCGACRLNLSLSLGSSRCISCSDHWPLILLAILMVAALLGIVLVALLLTLNLTVAVGTLNGIIFYANIVAANSSTFLPFSAPNYVTIFIAWLNLDFGFDTCFFPGMDAYWKTLLQLAFPTYVIFLVVMVIIISEHSPKFARIVAKRNPVATLATLILLSYTKLLNTVIASLSFAVLEYPDGSHHIVWLPDATVLYLQGKHTVLFILVLAILLAGSIYTGLLFFWQRFLKYQDKKLFTWTKYQKLCHFIEPYHAPFTFEERYWTGLLLLVRVILYIVSAVNITGDPRMALVSTAIVVGCLPALKGLLERKIYKVWLVDISELFIYINIIVFTTLTLYTFEGNKNQIAISYASIMLTFALLMVVTTFHLFHYTGLLSLLHKIKVKYFTHKRNNCNECHHVQAGTSIDDVSQPLITETVVELPKACPDTELELKVKNEEGSLNENSQTELVDVEVKPQSTEGGEASSLQTNQEAGKSSL